MRKRPALEPGVLRFEFFQDAVNPAHFSLFEIYTDMAARDAHLQTEHFQKWKEVYLATQEHKGDGHEFIAIYPEEGDWKKV